jgi:bifunctional DNA-binding transcriptional regulator/antitoxin component of YhaV-PrlF toxin-antitoxin module
VSRKRTFVRTLQKDRRVQPPAALLDDLGLERGDRVTVTIGPEDRKRVTVEKAIDILEQHDLIDVDESDLDPILDGLETAGLAAREP